MCHDLLGLVADEVVLVAPVAILRTASGKVRRNATGDALDADTLTRARHPRSCSSRASASRRPRVDGARPARSGHTALRPSPTRSWCPPPRAPSSSRAPVACGAAPPWRAARFVPCAAPWVLLRRRRTISRRRRRPGRRRRPTTSFIERPGLLRGRDVAAVFVGPASRSAARRCWERWCAIRNGVRPARPTPARPRPTASGRRRPPVPQLVVFPEGSLSGAVGVRPFHLGAFDAAVEGGARIVPVGIRGTRQVLAPGSRWPRRGAIRVVVGEPISPSGTDFWPRSRCATPLDAR